MELGGHLHNDGTLGDIFAIMNAKEHLQKEATSNHPENTRRKNNLHKKNKQRNSTLTMPRKKSIFMKEITPERTTSKCNTQEHLHIDAT
ncbi:hypothetical protein C922_05138 [Plasmodium inui San Antonio 1]|uniref:Uncharacterized protein n=1 Tax=Plasmodium inui San Antonio 1 TaxID=1237626 RepID=W6ZYV8_9APIC|nr:hypothetical protein C922_05138 [Plasmodium inui San Antonio 1]EUD64475.1 hypothetical protein C922_05138 [Plasmodium inui San Antonio 1]